MKMYIFIKDSIPDNFAPLVAAHASLSCYLAFKKDAGMIEWQKTSFKKVICRVSDSDFAWLKLWGITNNFDINVTTESALDSVQVAITYCPQKELPDFFKDFTLWNTKDS